MGKKMMAAASMSGIGITVLGVISMQKIEEGEPIIPIEDPFLAALASMSMVIIGTLIFGYFGKKYHESEDSTPEKRIKNTQPEDEFPREESSYLVGGDPESQPQSLKHEPKSNLTKLVFFNPFRKSSESSDDIIGKCSEIIYEDNLLGIGEEAIKNDEKPKNPVQLPSSASVSSP